MSAKTYAGAFPHPNGDGLTSEPNLLMKNNSGNVALCGAGEEPLGLNCNKLQGLTDEVASIEPLIPGCIYRVTAAGTFSAQADLYAAASGTVDDVAAGRRLFRAVEAAAAAGAEVMAQYLPGEYPGITSAEITFTEVALGGGGTYTGSVVVPSGATILDIVVNGVALWDDGTAAALIVGDTADPNGFFDAVNLKATDLLAGESISFSEAGGKAGAYIANDQVSPRYSATARTITGVVTVTDGDGTAGRTRIEVIYTVPESTTAATGALS